MRKSYKIKEKDEFKMIRFTKEYYKEIIKNKKDERPR